MLPEGKHPARLPRAAIEVADQLEVNRGFSRSGILLAAHLAVRLAAQKLVVEPTRSHPARPREFPMFFLTLS